MMKVHIPTLFLLIIVLSASLAIAIASISRAVEAEGTGYWALALGLNTLTYILFIQRGQVSDWLTIVLANVLSSVAFALFAQGILQFQKRTLSRTLIWAPVVITALVFAWLMPWQNARNIAAAAISLVQIALIVSLLMQKRRDTAGRGQYFVMTGFLILMPTLLLPGVWTLMHMHEENALLLPSMFRVIVFLVSPVCMVLLSLGLVVMCKERTEAINRDMATHDALTGLLNRRAVMDALDHHLAMAKRNGLPMGLLMLDIDLFKQVNDTYGHLSGDRVLQQMAKTLQERIRAQDQVGRYGGEEFLVIVPNTGVDGALVLAESLRKAIENVPFVTEKGRTITVTASIGVSVREASDSAQVEALIASADQALYRAKLGGRNRVEMFAGV